MRSIVAVLFVGAIAFMTIIAWTHGKPIALWVPLAFAIGAMGFFIASLMSKN